MRKLFLICLLAAGSLPLFAGCGGESTESRMRRMAKAQADANKDKGEIEEKAANSPPIAAADAGKAATPKPPAKEVSTVAQKPAGPGTFSLEIVPPVFTKRPADTSLVSSPSSPLSSDATDQRSSDTLSLPLRAAGAMWTKVQYGTTAWRRRSQPGTAPRTRSAIDVAGAVIRRSRRGFAGRGSRTTGRR